MIEDNNNDQEHNKLMSEYFKRIEKLVPNLTLTTFNEIINHQNFSIEDYEISKKISLQQDRETDKKKLKELYTQLMEEK